MTPQEIADWLLVDGDRCASVVADAYSSWDPERPWLEALEAEIGHRQLTAFLGEGRAPVRSIAAVMVPASSANGDPK